MTDVHESSRPDGSGKTQRGPRILITGGGTGGHVYPGLAVADALRKLAPAADVRFAGTGRSLESVLVPRAGFPFFRVPASAWRGKQALARFLFLANFMAGLLRSIGLLLNWRPAIVLGTGGYVSGPVMSAAWLLRIPCVLQEQNAVPGSANRLVGRWAKRVYLGPAAAARFFRSRVCLVTGSPVRSDFQRPDQSCGSGLAKGTGGGQVLIFGGSGGARTLNRAVMEAVNLWPDRSDFSLLVQTGRLDHDEVVRIHAGVGNERIRVVPYIEDMPAALAWADLVVCRAGAMTLAELQVVGRPAILVPFPHATDQHQLRNAQVCERAGAAVILADDECNGEALVAAVAKLLQDPTSRQNMAAAARKLGKPEAAGLIAADMLNMIGHPSGAPAEGQDQGDNEEAAKGVR